MISQSVSRMRNLLTDEFLGLTRQDLEMHSHLQTVNHMTLSWWGESKYPCNIIVKTQRGNIRREGDSIKN